MNIPILSFLNTFYLTLPILDKDKNEINMNFINKNLNNILIISLILILSICIELEMGKLFILLIILINTLLLMNNNLTDKLNLKEDLDNNFFYFLGVFLIVQIYLLRNNYIRGFLIFIILSILVMLEIQKYKIPNEFENNYKSNFKSNTKNFLMSLLMTILILSWGHYGKEPNVKYVKLFYRK